MGARACKGGERPHQRRGLGRGHAGVSGELHERDIQGLYDLSAANHVETRLLTGCVDALGDASTVFTEFPGLRKLKDSERVTCGSDTTPGPCTREKAMQYVLQTWPVS